MPTITVTGTYYHRAAWVENNWSRMATAHGSLGGWIDGTFNVQIVTIEGSAADNWQPINDNNYRVTSFLAGQAGSFNYSTGADFLGKGNYIHPLVTVVSINATNITNGTLYYAGSAGSFPTQDQNVPGSIDRHSLEILADEDISALLGLTGGETVTVVLDFPNSVFNPEYGLKIGFAQWTSGQQDYGLKIGFSAVIV